MDGRCADSRSAIFRRSTVCTQAKFSATARVLLACSRPMKCQVQLAPGEFIDLGQAFLQEILAEMFQPGAARRSQLLRCSDPSKRPEA